jgi:NAD(P)-dependent dehydrogenase (short-subunit alcohol dehydrogenase family)
MQITAIVPIKYHSARVPEKNFRLMNGKPLFHYILTTLSNCPSITRIVVNTDHVRIKKMISKNFPHILFYDRPSRLQGDRVSMNKVLLDTLIHTDYPTDLYLQTHTTNPLLTVQTIENAILTFSKVSSKHDSLFTVKPHQTRFYLKDGAPMNHDPNNLLPTQELEPVYEENSALYLFTKNVFMKHNRRIGTCPYLYPMTARESQDIDWKEDFRLAELLIKDKENKEKVVLITGVAGGIGEEIASLFRWEGWYVLGIDLRAPEHDYCSRFVECDLSSESQINGLVEHLGLDERRLDVIVNNAAAQLCKPLVETTVEEWDRILNCNLRPAFLLAKRLLPYLIQTKGSIVNISSVHATTTSRDIAAYATSKAGLSGLTRSMALEFGSQGVRVNAVLPGATDTPMLRAGLHRGHLNTEDGKESTEDDLVKALGAKHLQNRIGDPREIAQTVYFLADNEKSGFITGQNLIVDGGATIRLSTE